MKLLVKVTFGSLTAFCHGCSLLHYMPALALVLWHAVQWGRSHACTSRLSAKRSRFFPTAATALEQTNMHVKKEATSDIRNFIAR